MLQQSPHCRLITILIVGCTVLFTTKAYNLYSAIANQNTVNPSVEEYYNTLESRLGYWLLLGNARHCGYWSPGTVWPFPIGQAQRAMEEKLWQRLALSNGSKVLDAGAGSGIVASYMAQKGLLVEGVELTRIHVEQAQKVVYGRGLEEQVTVRLGDYHHLPETQYPNGSLDGIYTMETFVHADDPRNVLSNFYRLLRPGGVLVLHEADFHWDCELLHDVLRLSHCQNTLKEGVYEQLLQEAGFVDIDLEDLSENVLPLGYFFGFIGTIPYKLLQLFGLQRRFVNVMGGVEGNRHRNQGRYISIRAVKPWSDVAKLLHHGKTDSRGILWGLVRMTGKWIHN